LRFAIEFLDGSDAPLVANETTYSKFCAVRPSVRLKRHRLCRGIIEGVTPATAVYGHADRVFRRNVFADVVRQHTQATGPLVMVVPISSADFSHMVGRGPSRMTAGVIALVGPRGIVFAQETMFGNLKTRVVPLSEVKRFGSTLTNGAPYTIGLFAVNGYAMLYLDHTESAFELARALGVG
jgi:hypothetical protein